jgi:hypothetical protein
MGSTRHMLASLGLRSWQHIIVKGLHEHCMAAEVTGFRKTILVPRIQLRSSVQLCRRRFPIKIAFSMVKVKVKFFQERAMKAQRYSSTISLTSVLHEGGWSTPRPGRFTPGKEVRYPLYRWLGGPQGRSGRARKFSPPPGFDSPDRTARSESLYRLSYRGPLAFTMTINKAQGQTLKRVGIYLPSPAPPHPPPPPG